MVRNSERSETQLHNGRRSENAKALGLSQLLFSVRSMESVVLVLLFRVLRVSVQPNLQDDTVISKIDTYGAVPNQTYPRENRHPSVILRKS